MAHRKTGTTHKSDAPERRGCDGLTKELNPFNLGVDPGLDLNKVKSAPLTGGETTSENAPIPRDPRGRGR